MGMGIFPCILPQSVTHHALGRFQRSSRRLDGYDLGDPDAEVLKAVPLQMMCRKVPGLNLNLKFG